MKLPLFEHPKTGRPSIGLTMLAVAFTVLMLWLVLFVVGVPFVPAFDGATFAAVFSPIAALYFSGKWRQGVQEGGKAAPETATPEEPEK